MGNKQEGVIKFTLHSTDEPAVEASMITELNGWRHILHRLQLIGQIPERYMGFGFGNISKRSVDQPSSFIVSGTQTGQPPHLTADQYALVTDCEPLFNTITAKGAIKPSSEALTHGQLYQLDANIQCVVHAHSPEIWQAAEQLQLDLTSRDVAYGTAEMALEVERLFQTTAVRTNKIFVMGGHEDGVVSFGRDCAEACTVMISTLASAVMLRDK
jgi:ribulose-5-phosphate 4-epimerase/fuculose-1-phosphate aldolase